MGRPIASTEPNASRRITTAKPRPSASDDGASNSAKTWPPSSMSVPSIDGVTASMSFLISSASSNVMLGSSTSA